MANEDIETLIAKVQLANLESDMRNMKKPRTKSGDVSRMNPIYKPKASPGPLASSANVREGRSTDRTPVANRANAREGRPTQVKPTRPVAESTKSGKKVIERKSFRQSRGD